MFDDLTKEIKAQLYERAKGPLFTTFVISWFVFNIRAVVVFFSDISVEEKFAYWNFLYPDSAISFMHGFLYPLCVSILIILIYPFPARWAYHYWHWQYQKVKRIQQKLEDETPITQEEAKALRQVAIQEQTKLLEQLRNASNINNEQSAQISSLRSELFAAQESAKSMAEQREMLQKEIDSMKNPLSDFKELETGRNFDKLEFVENSDSHEESTNSNYFTSKLPAKVLTKLVANNLIDATLEVFLYIYFSGGSVETGRLSTFIRNNTKINSVELQYAKDQLIRKLFLVNEFRGSLIFTESGRRVAVESGLSKVRIDNDKNQNNGLIQ